jgi:diguanylate cyclase (GGDEF)-like protein
LLRRTSTGHRHSRAASLAITPTVGSGALAAAHAGSSAATRGAHSFLAPLAPVTAAIGAHHAAAAHGNDARAHRTTATTWSSFLGSVGIPHFIQFIPVFVWIALGAAVGLAAVAGAAAFRSGRRARRRAGEVAAVTAAALTDPLTGILNRRGFIESADRELDRARRYHHPLALAFVDIRGLKAVNDSEGHLAGDRLLKQVSQLLNESARSNDVVGRIGGDELAVLLPEQSMGGADAMIQRVRAQIPAARASLGVATAWDVTIGTSSFPEDGDNFEELLEAADRRLYEQRGINLAR